MSKELLKKLRILSAVAAVLIMAVIFVLSSQSGEASDEMSISFTSFLLSADFDFALFINFIVRKFAHLIEYAALAVPVYLFVESFKISEALCCIYSVLFTSLYAVSDEIHQYFVEGRSCQIDDIFLDSAGGLIAVIIIHLIFSALRKKNKKILPNTDAFFLKLFSSYISGDYESTEPADDETLMSIIEKAFHHKLLPVTTVAMTKCGAVLPKSEIYNVLRDESQKHVFIQTVKTQKFLEVYKLMTEAGARPICVKGIICRYYYPEPDFRESSDEDIIVSEQDYSICADVLEKCGFVRSVDKPNEIGFSHAQSGLKIEVHKTMFPNSGVYSKFNELLGDMSESCGSLIYDNTEIICPSADKHFLYLVLHAFKHFTGSGVGIRQICDMAMFARENRINWAQINEKCEKVGAAGFFNAVLVVANKYFGLELSDVKSAVPSFKEDMNTNNFVEDLVEGGLYGSNSIDRVHSGLITLNKYSSSKQDEKISALFPPLNKMKKKYPFLNKYPIMLPVAWVMRLASYTASEHDSSKTIEIGKKRVALMKELNVI